MKPVGSGKTHDLQHLLAGSIFEAPSSAVRQNKAVDPPYVATPSDAQWLDSERRHRAFSAFFGSFWRSGPTTGGVVADLNIWKGRTRSARHFDTTHNSVASLQLQSCTFRCRFIAPRGNANCPTFRASERLLKSATQKFRATPIRSHLDLVDGTGQIGCKERTDSIHPVEKTRLNLPV